MFQKTEETNIDEGRLTHQQDATKKAWQDFQTEAKEMGLYRFETHWDWAPYIRESTLKIQSRRQKLYFVSDRLFPLFY